MSEVKNPKALSIIAKTTDNASREESIKAIKALKADDTIDEAEALDAIELLEAMKFGTSPAKNSLLESMGIVGNSKPEGYRDSKDLFQQADHNIRVLAIEFSSWDEDTRKSTRKKLTGDEAIDKGIKDEALKSGLVYMRLSNGANVSLSKHNLPQDENGVECIPSVGDTVSVATISLGDVIDTSQNAELGVQDPAKSPYGIFEHTDGQKYAMCRVKGGITRLLTVKRALSMSQKVELLSAMKVEISAKEALAQMGF